MLIYLTLLRFHTLKKGKKRKTKHLFFLKAQSESLIFRELLCPCRLSCSTSTVGCTSGRRDAWNPQRWESLQVSFFRRQTAAFECYNFPPQTSPRWAKQIKLHHKLQCSSCDNFFYWRLEGKRLTHVWFSNHRDNISFLWAPWGGRGWRVSHSSLKCPESIALRDTWATRR